MDNYRFATAGFYKNVLQISVHQYKKSKYDASEMFPTKIEISLTEDEWTKLTAHLDDISEELKAKTTGTEYHTGNEKYLLLSCFGDKGHITISIKQHYTFDDGI